MARLGDGVGNPNLLCRAGQVSLSDPNGADFVVIGMGLLEFAHLATLQHLDLSLPRGQQAGHEEAVAGGFQNEAVLGSGMLKGPAFKAGHWDFIEGLVYDCTSRSVAADNGSGEDVRVGVKADDSWQRLGLIVVVHRVCFIVRVMQTDGEGTGAYMHSGMRGDPQCRCFAPVLDSQKRRLNSKRSFRVCPESPPAG